MEIRLDPTYIAAFGNRLSPKNQSVMVCPVCGTEAIKPDREEGGPWLVCFYCINRHHFAWEFVDTTMSIVLLSIVVLVTPTDLALKLAPKWRYDPSRRFVNSGGYQPASMAQINKIRELAGPNPNAFHELFLLITNYWNYKGFDGWSSNDAGFVIAWLSGKYGEFPKIDPYRASITEIEIEEDG